MEKLQGEVTEQQIADWKEKHGKIFKYEVDGKVAYLRTVDRNTYSLAVSKMSSNPTKFNEIVIQNIWLGGAEELRKEDGYYFGLIEMIEELMARKKGSLGEL